MTVHHTLESQQIYLINLVSLRLLFEKCVTGIKGMIREENNVERIYYFDKNTLGDIVAIRNGNGNIVATYEYDAWGNVTVKDEYGIIETSATFIGNINPYRYRGYYYDTETGFYYLQSRYYDPTICRFINADNYELVAELSCVAGELNMYAYCNNNPVMFTDESGESFFLTALLIGIIVGAVVGGTVAGIDAANNGETGWDLVGSIAQGALIGGGVGAIAGAFVGAMPTIVSFLGTYFTFGSGAMAISVSGAQIVAGATIGALGLSVLFSNIPMHGKPNSSIKNGDSFGEYDCNGNLSFRTDTGHSHFIKEYGDYFRPHTHHFRWRLVKGIWRFIEEVLPW